MGGGSAGWQCPIWVEDGAGGVLFGEDGPGVSRQSVVDADGEVRERGFGPKH